MTWRCLHKLFISLAEFLVRNLLKDFNVNAENASMKRFWKNYSVTCVVLILTNRSRSFSKTCVIETGLPDDDKLVTTVMKIHFSKSKPSIITLITKTSRKK